MQPLVIHLAEEVWSHAALHTATNRSHCAHFLRDKCVTTTCTYSVSIYWATAWSGTKNVCVTLVQKKPYTFTHSVSFCVASYNSRRRGYDAVSKGYSQHVVSSEPFHISAVSEIRLILKRISLLALKRCSDDTPDGNPTVAQLVKRTRKFIVVVTKAGNSSIYSTPTEPPLPRIHHGSPSFHNGTWPQHPQTNICTSQIFP